MVLSTVMVLAVSDTKISWTLKNQYTLHNSIRVMNNTKCDRTESHLTLRSLTGLVGYVVLLAMLSAPTEFLHFSYAMLFKEQFVFNLIQPPTFTE